MEAMRNMYLGGITACIAGDHRYSTTIEVRLEGDIAVIQQKENGANGGMDGDGTSLPFGVTKQVKCPAVAKDIVKEVKNLIKRESPAIIKEYGKPTKRFWWSPIKKNGLSVALCAEALEALKGE